MVLQLISDDWRGLVFMSLSADHSHTEFLHALKMRVS